MDRIVSASADKSLRVWAVDSGEELAALLGHRDWVNSCDVSHDGLLIVSGASDKTLRVWDAVTYGRRIALVAHRDSVNACRFSPDGVAIASASDDGTVKVWQVAALREAWEAPPAVDVRSTVEESERRLRPVLLLGHEGSVNDCAFSPDGSVVVSAFSDRSIRIWDASTGAMRRTIAAHRREVTGCAISRDGAFIASVSNDRTIKVWDTPTGQCVSTLHVDGALDQCAWLADNRRLVAVGAGGVYFLERST
jgi:WD40 repeat protein